MDSYLTIQPVAPKDKSSVQAWIETNNRVIFALLTGETIEAQQLDNNMRLKLIAQLKMRNKELRMLRINRVTDKLVDKVEAGVDYLMKAGGEANVEFMPIYLSILHSLQETAKATCEEINTGDALLFDAIEAERKTGLPDASRDRIRSTAKELLSLCTTTSDKSETP